MNEYVEEAQASRDVPDPDSTVRTSRARARAFSKQHEDGRVLNPVFLMGMQRSGTSILAMALAELGLHGFAEGHLWLFVPEALRRLRDLSVKTDLKGPHFALGQDRVAVFERHIARAIDDFHREEIPCPPESRWYDKSPSSFAIENAPMLAELFPEAQFIFVHRHPVGVVESGMRIWGDRPGQFGVLCRGWEEAMRAWRDVREGLGERALEVEHAVLASEPERVAEAFSSFVGCPERAKHVTTLFRSRRQNSSFPDREPGDYLVRIEMNRAMRRKVVAICGDEMERWNYSVPFDAKGNVIEGMGVEDTVIKRGVGLRIRAAAGLVKAGAWQTLGSEIKGYISWVVKGRPGSHRRIG